MVLAKSLCRRLMAFLPLRDPLYSLTVSYLSSMNIYLPVQKGGFLETACPEIRLGGSWLLVPADENIAACLFGCFNLYSQLDNFLKV